MKGKETKKKGVRESVGWGGRRRGRRRMNWVGLGRVGWGREKEREKEGGLMLE